MPARVGKGLGGRPRLLCPEVVQTSQMDCGPAAVKALLEGFGLRTSYGRLREACQTDVDGTAIGALEELIGQLGLGIEQVMVPIDHVLLEERNLPSIAVVLTGTGTTHYVVAWRIHGRWVQVMDPAAGRRFMRAETFERALYRHEHPVDAAAWRDWAASEDFTDALASRLEQLGADPRASIDRALADPSWRSLAALDATTRLLKVLATGGAIPRGSELDQLVWSFVESAVAELSTDATGPRAVPERYWTVWPDPSTEHETGEPRLLLRGAVLLRVTARPDASYTPESGPVDASMLHAIREGDDSPWRLLLDLVRRRGRRLMTAMTLGMASSSILVALEALLLLGLIRAAGQLEGVGQLPAAIASVVVFVAGVAALQLAIASGAVFLGRQLELRVRTAFLRKIPRLGDRFFQSRLRSDMAERAHSVVSLRQLPAHVAELAGSASGLVATAVAVALFFPDVAGLAVLLALSSVAIPLAAQPALLDLAANLRAYAGGLSSYYLDALRGLTAIRAHRGESSLRREHQRVLDLWLRSALSFNSRVVWLDALQTVVGLSLTAAMLLQHTDRHGLGGGVLLLAYWALAVPELGAAFARDIQQLPDFRSIAARFAEPIQAPEESEPSAPPPLLRAGGRGVTVGLEDVSVVASGHTLLHGIEARFGAGERIAVLGASGAGKSTLLALLLGWHRAATGRVLIDDAPLAAAVLESLRERTAWVDPAVTLWNRSLLFNVRYGDSRGSEPIDAIWRAADLRNVIAGLPSGLATALGEDGCRLAGGEGQRVRLARALARRHADLVVLDEPFRGLDRTRRRAALEQAFGWWRGATILCATHDLQVAGLFDRVAVLNEGELVELDTPGALSSRASSHLSRLLEAEDRREQVWRSSRWRRLWMVDGALSSIGGDGAQRA